MDGSDGEPGACARRGTTLPRKQAATQPLSHPETRHRRQQIATPRGGHRGGQGHPFWVAEETWTQAAAPDTPPQTRTLALNLTLVFLLPAHKQAAAALGELAEREGSAEMLENESEWRAAEA